MSCSMAGRGTGDRARDPRGRPGCLPAGDGPLQPMTVRERLAEDNPEAVLWDGCDEALVGMGYRCGKRMLAVYDYDLLVKVFVDQGMSEEEAGEWVEFNIVGAWVGENTPITLYAT